MLNIIAGDFENRVFSGLVKSCEGYFNNHYRSGWVKSDFGRRVLSDVDNMSEILGENLFIRKDGIPCRITDISHGSKTILTMKFDGRKRIYDSRFIGSNVLKYLSEVSLEKDVYVLTSSILGGTYGDLNGRVLNTGYEFKTKSELNNYLIENELYWTYLDSIEEGVLVAKPYNYRLNNEDEEEQYISEKEYKIYW